ncbi:non-ribosomal peptide synthase/polyketide synthase [Myxococcus sp. CA051A]|uniref:non-ribosomal peptide synthase/polyketide synthase n=1 Tax=Myxococcus sp. CA051A TaxID=2741739 RepID=UPI00157B1317|nr:non-ribosomal peptide synthetase [Myxococcus sp. CA051A]NTX63938.1 non-ribosomal peptide synthase/polyketide synthase [Myxococcus sp. CA051A]
MSDNIEDLYPLSPLQGGMLFHAIAEPGEGLYFNQLVCELRGQLDVDAFIQAWRGAVAAHPALRTALVWDDVDEPVQVVLREVELPVRVEDWRDLSADAFEARLSTFLEQDRREGFDLSRAPLIRLTLLRSAADAYRFVFSHSHLVLDGWSVPLVVRDFFTLYEGSLAGRSPRLVSPRPFSDYLGWLAEHDLKDSEDFWRRELAGVDEPTPTGEGAGEGTGRITRTRHLSESTTAALNTFARRHGLTLSTLVQGAWALVLGQLSGAEDVIFGTTVSGRPPDLAGVEDMVGLFINTQPVRVRWSQDLTWSTWLRRIQDTQVEARQHEHAPLVKVQRWSNVPAGTSLFDTLVVFENYPLDAALTSSARALEVRDVRAREADHFGLTLISTSGAKLPLLLRYDQTRFTQAFADARLERMVLVLEAIAARPEGRLGELSLLSGAERHQLLVTWNDTRADFPEQATVHGLFEEAVSRTPDALAVSMGDVRWSYRELDARANQLAHHLRGLGVRRGTLVGLCFRRSPDMVVALWAVLKAGGAYVPIDPAWPSTRVSFLLEDTGVPVVLTEEVLADALPATSQFLLCLDTDWARTAGREPVTPPEPLAGAGDLAYLIYTSGSTGRPKGVMVEHRGVVNYLTWAQRAYGLAEGSGSPVHSPLSFDLTVTSLVAPLVAGRPVVLVPEDVGIEGLGEALRAGNHFSLVKLTPTHLRMLAAQLRPEEAAGRTRAFVIGGEALTAEGIAFWREHAPDTRLINEYGPTETVVGCCVYTVSAADPVSGPVAIGRPIANTRLYVLDASLGPVPVGVVGELFIGGSGVARGYWRRPELTAERFIPDAFGTEPGARLYRTGDRVRWRADGRLEYLGRADFQVKVRGYRIELGEVESVLRTHPSVGDAVAVVREDVPSGARLVAYVVPSGAQRPESSALREFLEERLPEYMVPAAFVVLEAFPLSDNGKVERRALPAPELTVVERTAEIAPRDAKEEALASIWAQVLGRPQVSVHEDFFELGGDSILGIQVISRAAQAGLHLSAKQLFDHPTVARLAAVVSEAPREVIAQGPVTGPVELTPIQRWFLARELSGAHHFNQALRFTLRERMVAAHLDRALQLVREHHDALRLRFTRDGQGGWHQELMGLEGTLPLETVDLSRCAPGARSAEVEAYSARVQERLKPSTGDVARAVLFDLGPEVPQELLLVIHHLAVDAVSWRVLLEDLLSAYQRLRADEPVRLPAKTLSYQSWASRLVEHARTPSAREEATFWLGLPWARVGSLPREVEGGVANTEGASRLVEVTLEPGETQVLLQDVAKAFRAKPDELLLAALAHVLRRWTGASCVRVEMEGHGRENLFGEVDLSRTVGWFTSLYPVLVESMGDGPGAWVRAAKEAVRRTPSKGVGFGVLRYLSPDRALRERLSALPVPEVGFNYLGQFDNVLPATAPLRLSEGSAGPTHAPEGLRAHLLDVDCAVSGGRMRLMFTHGSGIHRTETVERLAHALRAALRELIAHGTSEDPRGLSPLDFPLAKLGQGALEGLADRLASQGQRLRDVEDLYPLSPLQQGILFHHLQEDETQPYFNQIAFELDGALDVTALTEAWRQAAQRFTILRTAFFWEGLDAPLQAVMRDVEPTVSVEDWRTVPREELEARVSAFFVADRRRGFELSVAPLFRLALFRTDERVWRVVFSVTHLLLDGWSTQLVTRDVFTRYEALRRGVTPPRGDVRPYRDFIAWLEGQDQGAARDFWRKALVGFAEPTRLNVGGVPRGQGERGDEEVRLGAEETSAFGAFARQQGLTPGTLLQGAWAVLLGRYSGGDDVVFGLTVSGRPPELAGIESMVGMFINAIPVRVRMPASRPVGPWLKELQSWLQEARQYESSPLVEVRRWSEVPSSEPLFESLVIYENYPMEAGLSTPSDELVVRNPTSMEVDHHPLTLMALPGHELVLRLTYDARRFGATGVRRMLAHLRHVLRELREKVERPLSELALLDVEERRQVLTEWNPLARDAHVPVAVFRPVEAQVARVPEAIAVTDGTRALTYAELEARANQLAHHLAELGVSVGSKVGLCLDKSLDLAVAVLGTLKAGATYVPLDPRYPAERLTFMLEDSGAVVVLSHSRLGTVLPVDSRARRVFMDLESEALARQPTRAPAREVPPELACYVIYTSGSTGRPKGVALSHRALSHLLTWQLERSVNPTATTLQFAALSFDVSFQEMFSTWWAGGTLVLPSEDVRQDLSALLTFLDRHAVERLFLPFVALQALAEVAVQSPTVPRALREVVTAGEQLQVTPSLVAFFERLPGCVLENQYGPSETHVVSAHRLRGAPSSWPRLPSVGAPLPHCQLYVLDAWGQPCPVGISGELFIGGAHLAHGYVGRPELTAEKFVPHPFSEEAGARLYRTGDLARWTAEGTVEFVGRLDGQVKLRGFRIELGEVEAALRAAPGVRDAAVVVREDVPGDRRLVGYVVLSEPEGAKREALRAHVGAHLPEYMVPSTFVTLDALPLTPSGKVNRKALPVVDAGREGVSAYVAPRTATEDLLAGLFAEVLGLDRVGLYGHFFELGGHSLLATRAISRVRSAFGIELPLRELFEAPTVAELASRVDRLIRTGAAQVSPPLVPREGKSRPPRLSFAQQRLWFLDQLEPLSASYNVPGAVRMTGPLNRDALARTFQELVRRHEALRTTFRSVNGVAVQIVAPESPVVLHDVDLEGLPEERREAEARRHVEQAVLLPFDLTVGPLLRVTLVRLSAEAHVLVVVLHHIVSDGWSTEVLVREVAALYEAYAAGKPSPLGELPVQYADYAEWQRGWLQGEVLEQQVEYWRRQLEGAPKALELVTDKPRPAVQSFRGAMLERRWPKELWRKVEEASRREGATPFMVLLAAYQVVLARYAGQEEVVVGFPIAGRTHAETEGLIGYFANTLVLRGRVREEESFRELVGRAREVTLGAYAHQDVPFEKLVEELVPRRDMSRSPLFQVSLTLQNTPGVEVKLGEGLVLKGLETDTKTSKFDFSLLVGEDSEGMGASLNYNSDLYEEGTAARLVEHVRAVLEGAVEGLEKKVWQVPLVGAEEQRRLVREWSGREKRGARGDETLAAHFEAQVEKTPGAVAVECGEESLTYAQLNERANQLAHHLRGVGVGPEVRVGLCVERGVEWVVSVLGVVKAGGAYVPLEAGVPAERLRWMKREAGVAVVVGTDAQVEEVAESADVVVSVDGEGSTIARQPRSNPSLRGSGGNLAYVMYTSGSTGTPKGVGVPQRAVARLVLGASYARFGADEVWLQLAPVSFDASTLEVWGALLHGAKLVVYPAKEVSLEEVGRELTKSGVTSLWLTAALFEQMQAYQPEALKGVRQVLAGGDVLPAQRVRERLRQGGTLINGYGPTENTTFTTAYRMEGEAAAGARGIPIGKPVEGTEVYVLDARMNPVAVGVPGELYAGGEGLAQGYVGRPDWTAERFVPSPFGEGERLYRTGDVVRWRGDGVLEFLGRRDSQVKVRGYRIELGEVEEGLKQQAGVKEAVAVVREERGDKKLVGYVVGTGLDASVVKEGLRRKLPEYLVPTVVVVLEALPLTANGKVDRGALPAPEDVTQAVEEYEAPREGMEAKLAEVFAEVLGAKRVGRKDDFFELGGHSLLATQVVARVRALTGVDLPLRTLFEAPTLEALAARIDSSREAGPSSEAFPLVALPRTGMPPLSFAQHRLWFFDQLSPGSAAYNIPIHLQVEGALNLVALQRAFSALVARHEALRTTFALHEGEPVQVIHPPTDFPLAVEDLGQLTELEREAEVRRRAVEDSLRPFDLGQKWLVRATLSRLEPEVHVLSLVMHHIIADGWSLGVLVRELSTLYVAFSEGRASPLAALPVQYADYARWQREWLSGERLEAQLDGWRKRLAGAPPHLELPTDGPRPAILSHRGATVPVRLSRELSDAIGALARAEGATPFMVLLAAFQVLLARYSGQEDVSVGSPIAGRRYAETEGLIGFFVNTLVLRAQARPRDTFRELLAQVRETTLGAYEHQDLPFEKLVEALHPVRDLSRTALFQVLFVLQNAPVEALELPALSLKPVPTEGTESARFELSLNLSESAEGFAGTLLFNSDLFLASTAVRMVSHLQVLLESITANPEQRLAALPLMTASERRHVLESWSTATADAPFEAALLHQLIERQVARTPDAPAVCCEETVLSYRQLDARANQLAHHLRALGVGPDVPVALCLERSAELVVALLGVLKAGGAYVPLEPSQPASRLCLMVEEVAAPVVVTESRHEALFQACAARRVQLDTEAEQLALQRVDAPDHRGASENLAYVLFTSGSTGRPKGVAVSHGALVNYVQAATERLKLSECSSFALVSTFGADLGNTVLFPALCTGGVLHVLTAERAGNPVGVAEYFQRHGVDCVKIVPAHLSALLTAPAPARVLPRKRLVLGGESSTWALLEQVRALAPECEVFNHYGPTETTVGVLAGGVDTGEAIVAPHSTPARADAGPSTRRGAVPLGRPLANARVYVLDDELRPVPVGVPGELFIGGAQVARGYLSRAELTAERFGPDPFSAVPGARMYRTGDRVRWLADGRVEFLGRSDFQVKVRGFRVEPGEVAAVLREHPSVKDAVVVAREDTPGDQRLVAYVLADSGQATEVGALRGFLQERLPAHMVPSAFMWLDVLPLTPNGKLDRRALPVPESGAMVSGAAHVPPATPMEEALASIWAEVLRVERVGRHDDFFALGGHSLVATQVVARLRASLGVEVPLRALFEAPTLEALARKVDQVARAVSLPALRPSPRKSALPLSFAQQRLWFLDRLEPGSVAYNVPTALRLDGPLDVGALERAFAEVVRRHESLRTSFPDEGGVPVQVIQPPTAFQLQRVELPEDEATVLRWVGEEVARPFDLKRGPLLRVTLVRLSAESHVLVVVLHHIVSDGWSTAVLVREVVALYEAYAAGKPSPLGELPVQYADYAAWQRGWLQGDALEKQLSWWRQEMAGAAQALELPTDRPRSSNGSARAAAVPIRIRRESTEALRALCQQEGLTPFMGMLAIWQLLLARYSGQDDVCVGSPIAGRRFAELEGLIGFFVNTLVLRARIDSRATFRELLAQVRKNTLAAYEHQDIPFEKLVEELQPERNLSRSPLFQVMFELHALGESRRSHAGLELSPLALNPGNAKFELILDMGFVEDGSLEGRLEYNTDLFDASTAERMMRHLEVLISAVLARPDAPLATCSLLPGEEREQLLSRWSGTQAAFPHQACLHELVIPASRDLDSAAIESSSGALTYRELERRANQLAWHLRSLGVGPEVRVALCMERSPELIVSMLGVLKAGGAYVPLDPMQPPVRLAFMLQDCGATVLLTQQPFAARLPAFSGATVCVDTAELSRQREDAPVSGVMAENLAYVIYTSGSTGQPKGVLVTHRAVCNLVHWEKQAYALGPSSQVLQFANPSFDLSVEEIFSTLTAGGTLHVLTTEQAMPGPALHELLRRSSISVLSLTPAVLAATAAEELPALRTVISGGEACSAELVSRWAPGRTFLNTYGPTEATVVATLRECAPQEGQPPPIGRPLTNVRVYVLDERLEPVPVGLPGELFIGGVQLARGYLGRPELTAESFIPHPFSTEPGARLYRTGDVVRWRADGQLAFVGRADDQVKLRGLRIELGEVESALHQNPEVREAVALVREDVPGDKRLVAYVVPRQGAGPEPLALRGFLQERIPKYMVPSAFVVMAALPLTANGKVDRRALPVPDTTRAVQDRYEAPRNDTEQQLAALWSEVLGVEKVGIHDDFFELGGHSLLATQVVARVRARTGVDVPLRALFEAPTVEQLASWVEGTRAGGSVRDCVTLQADGSGTPVFFVHAVGGAVGPYRLFARTLGTERPFYGLQAPGLDGDEAPLEQVEALARRYIASMRAVQPEGPYILGGWSMGGVVAFEMARELERQGQRVEQLVLLDSFAPGDESLMTVPEDALLLTGMAMDLARAAGSESTLRPELLMGLTEDGQLARFAEHARVAVWLPPEVRDTDLRAWRDVTRANLRALSTYRPGPYAGPMLLLRAKDARRERAVDASHGWSRWVPPGQLKLEDVAGDHYSMLRAPYVHALASRLARILGDEEADEDRDAGT